MLIRGGKFFIQQQLISGHELLVEDKLIRTIQTESNSYADIILAEDDILTPSFTDLHIHGACGKDVMDGSIEALQIIAEALLREGVTGFLATTMTEPLDKIEAALNACHEFRAKQTHGARLLGVHLEGPFLSQKYMGAQCGDHLQLPDVALLKKWLKQFPDLIKLITIAPELPKALDFIEYAVKQGIVISVGHTNANFLETEQAINAGSTYATHLYNAMSGIHHRTPGAAAAILMDDRVTAELILDGAHVSPEMVRFTVKCKGLPHLILVTDAMRAKCLKAGVYDLGGQNVKVDDQGIARLVSNEKLAGSTLKLNQALKNMHDFTHLPLSQLLPLVTERPLHLLKISTSGMIASGQLANLVILNKELKIKGVIHHGSLVYQC